MGIKISNFPSPIPLLWASIYPVYIHIASASGRMRWVGLRGLWTHTLVKEVQDDRATDPDTLRHFSVDRCYPHAFSFNKVPDVFVDLFGLDAIIAGPDEEVVETVNRRKARGRDIVVVCFRLTGVDAQ